MNAAEAYAARIAAVTAQRAQLHGERRPVDRWDTRAAAFRMDPHRPLDPNLAVVASYVEPGDVLVDAGGGAGRHGLPLALRCREVINVEPSSGMVEQFRASAAEAGITNIRVISADWLDVEAIEGDVVLAAHVTYFVGDIARFVEKLVAAARRRVIIDVMSVPPPAQDSKLFRIVYGIDQVLAPGHRELLPALWDMGIVPDVRVLPGEGRSSSYGAPLPSTHTDAVQLAVKQIEATDHERASERIEAHFDELFAKTDNGYRPLWRPATVREMLITWETGRSR